MTERLLEDGPEVWLQFLIWGYAVTGDVCERGAAYAEGTERTILSTQAWDHNEAWLGSHLVAHGDEPYGPAPASCSLPWVSEQRVREALAGAA